MLYARRENGKLYFAVEAYSFLNLLSVIKMQLKLMQLRLYFHQQISNIAQYYISVKFISKP